MSEFKRETPSTEEGTPLLLEPITLHPELVLTNEDVEESLTTAAVGGTTMRWMSKPGYPSYSLNPSTRLLVISLEGGTKVFRLKELSPLITGFKEKYGNG